MRRNCPPRDRTGEHPAPALSREHDVVAAIVEGSSLHGENHDRNPHELEWQWQPYEALHEREHRDRDRDDLE